MRARGKKKGPSPFCDVSPTEGISRRKGRSSRATCRDSRAEPGGARSRKKSDDKGDAVGAKKNTLFDEVVVGRAKPRWR